MANGKNALLHKISAVIIRFLPYIVALASQLLVVKDRRAQTKLRNVIQLINRGEPDIYEIEF